MSLESNETTCHSNLKINQSDKHNESRELLESWLNKVLKVEITDGRILVGTFLCTDRDLNIILGSCLEYVKEEDKDSAEEPEEPRSIGLVMISQRHIVSICVDVPVN